jgi:CHAT domain
VEAGSEAVLSYAIDHQAVFERSAPVTLSVPQGVTEVPLVVAVHAGSFRVYDFESGEARNFHRVTLRLDAPAPLAGQFLLRAPETATELATEVDVRFLHQGLPVGEVSIPTAIAPRPAPAAAAAPPAGDAPGRSAGGGREIMASPLSIGGASPPGAPTPERERGPSGGVGAIAISFAAAPPPDLVLRVREAGAGRYELTVDRDGGTGARFYDRPLGAFPVTDRAATYTEGVLETLRDARRLLPEVRVPRVEGVGRALWRNLPEDFRDFYWAEMHGRELSIAIYSDEPYVPWELIVPEAPDGAAAPMLGVAFSVARWKRARFFPDPLRVAGFAVVVPAYATPLPYAEEEAGELQRRFGARRVPGEYAAVVELLRSRGLQAIHFAGHGRFDPGAADASELLLADAPLRPTDVAGATFGQAERPLVFVNACEVGQQEWALTQIGGWAEAFCAAGCTAFVGPYWPVEDRVAARAARVFYEALREGETVGRAMQAVRRRFHTDAEFPAHPTWLAYTLHCQPNVTVQFLSPPGP